MHGLLHGLLQSMKIFFETLYQQKLFKIFLQNKIVRILYIYFRSLNLRYS
jgi:hypothetical protein